MRYMYTSHHNMLNINSVIFPALAFLLQHHASAGKPYDVHIVETNVICKSEEYFSEAEVSAVEDGDTKTFNSKCTVIKTIPEDTECVTEFFKETEEGWEKSPISIARGPCCKVLTENRIYKTFTKDHDIQCPIKEGAYHIENYKFDTSQQSKYDPPRGIYKAEFKSSLADGTCIFGLEMKVKISDKAE